MKKRFITLLIVGMATSSSATVINIPDDYPTIQQGIGASTNGDTVLVQPGTYNEEVDFNGHNVVLGSWFLTTGDSSFISQTVIDDGSVWFDSGEDSTAHISGFTLHGLYGVGSAIFCDSSSPTISYNIISEAYVIGYGAGVRCENYASPIITNNLIIDNSTYGGDTDGGGIFIGANCCPLVKENTIIDNFAVENGGGIYCGGNAAIVNNIIYSNSSIFSGGGIFCASAGAIISGNEIIDNWTGYLGGGVACWYSDTIIIIKNIIARNRASNNSENGRGGAIYGWEADFSVINNTVYGNKADSIGGAVHCVRSNPVMINNIFFADSIGYPLPSEANEFNFYNSPPVIEYCDIQGGWPGTGNIDLDPLFRNPAGGDYHLMSTACGNPYDSPCIDAGSPYYADSLLDCAWGLGTSVSDMGTHGGGDTAFVGIFDPASSLPDRFALLQNFPNPFNAQTNIRVVLSESQSIELTVYDLLGRQIETLIDKPMETGIHTVTFDASSFSSGVYFYRLRAGNAVETKRMVLLK